MIGLTNSKFGGGILRNTNKKGFTLIELLAVIVILAIIALISVPIILNMIENAKKSAAVDSAYGYIDSIEKNNALASMDSEEYTAISDGENIDISDINVSLKGTVPTSGNVTISSGRVTEATLTINGYIIKYDGTTAKVQGTNSEDSSNNVSVTYQVYKTGTEDEVSVIYFNPTTGEKCSSSDAVSTTGTKSGCMKWYAIENSGETKSTVDVILDHNTTSAISWNESGKNATGPSSTFLNKLYNDTKEWEGVNNRTDKYTVDNGTSKYTIDYSNYKARIITANEVAKIVNNTDFSSLNDTDWFYFDSLTKEEIANKDNLSKYNWLFDNTIGCKKWGCKLELEEVSEEPYAYWSSDSVYGDDQVWDIDRVGVLGYYPPDTTYNIGIRPVITISKELLK